MIKKWDLIPSPSEKNPTRHKFLINGEMRDIFLVVKKLGSICSRPEKTAGDFNFIIYLSKLETDTLVKIKALVSESGVPSDATPPREASPIARGGEEPEPFESSRPRVKIATTDEPFQIPAAGPNTDIEPVPETHAKIPEVYTPPESIQPTSDKPQSDSDRVRPFVPPAASSRIKAEEAKPEEKPADTPKPHISSRTRAKWSVELPLVPTQNLKTLVHGSHNRFAHAAAMAVVENPGVMYNPLLIFGLPGTGKTHFVHAISYGLALSMGQKNVFVTDGIKLSKGVAMAVKDGSIGRLADVMAQAKALIIDDVHLLMLNAVNKPHISKWLNEFMAKDKQIVATSVFPPKSLGGLEEAVGFQFTQGWMVDLKVQPPQTYHAILQQLLEGMDVKLSEEELNNIFVSRQVPFGEAIRTLGSMKKLERFSSNAAQPPSHAKLLDMLLGFSETHTNDVVMETEHAQASGWSPSSSASWFKWGIFYPKGMRREAHYALYRMHLRSVELGLNMEWEQIFMEEYNSDELYGVPFKLGDLASEKNVNGVIVLGPQPTSALGAQESEFWHITMKILDSFLVKGAWIQLREIKSPAVYTKALMDLL
jgi:chromosomal replication initiator protein